MKITIAHHIKGRIRFKTKYKFSGYEAAALKKLLMKLPSVSDVEVYKLSGSIRVDYKDSIKEVRDFLQQVSIPDLENVELPDYVEGSDRGLFEIVRDSLEKRFVIKYLMPTPIRTAYTLYGAARFIYRGLKEFFIRRKLVVELMDAVAIASSVADKDYASAADIMWLLGLGGEIEDWTLEKSKDDLAKGLALNVNTVWVRDGDRLFEKPLSDVEPGDLVQVNAGHSIPVDGIVVDGEASVNQSSFTGEGLAVRKSAGSGVFAGTVLEEGSLLIDVRKKYNESRIHDIIVSLSESEQLKSESWKKAESMADGLVKYSFIGALVSYLLTRDFQKAKTFLMVDYSCALKLAIPIATMAAMRQALERKSLVKGGIHLENLAEADTIVFDKTGTLTQASPQVVDIIPFGDFDKDEVLRIGACLEEHFPHPIANAVVDYAQKANILHKGENHSQPEYITAHGIVANIEGKRALIGSRHFLFDDEKIGLTPDQEDKIRKLVNNYSLLYLALGDKLIGVFCIDDPVKKEMPDILGKLRKIGIEKIIMLTGDSENAARSAAESLKLDDYRSSMLPEDKAAYIDQLKAGGAKVVMVGDGINDSLALSKASVGIAMDSSADVASSVANITLKTDDLYALVDLILIAKAMKERINTSYRKIISVNSALIGLGLIGSITPRSASLVHNLSTLEIGITNMSSYRLQA